MTSLLFCTSPTQAMIAMDTLVVSDEIGTPVKWTTKALPLLHMRLVVAGTGIAGFVDDWIASIQNHVLTGDIDDLEFLAPEYLNDLWTKYDTVATMKGLSTTVYHFGFSRKKNCIRTFVHRSTNGFLCEPLDFGRGGKPDYDESLLKNLPAGFVQTMHDQRRRQELLAPEDRVHIGGEIHLFHLTESGIDCSSIHRFSDFDAMETGMLRRRFLGE